jgi:WhiB family redox-sensing transcriptional regulator
MTTTGTPHSVLKRLFDDDLPPEGGLCAEVDPKIFYPDKGETVNEAKKICRRCPVMSECGAWALRHAEPFGVWGGMSVNDREKALGKGLSPGRRLG